MSDTLIPARKIVITDMQGIGRRPDAVYRVCALFEHDHLTQIQCEKKGAESVLGGIYLGRVKKAVPSLNAVFVEIAPGNECYLSLKDAGEEPTFTKKINSPKLVQGDELIVQVQREAIKMKPAALTGNINFTGKYVVLTSQDRRIAISSKLSQDDSQRLFGIMDHLWAGDCGVIVRTAAAEVSEEELKAEYESLHSEYAQILEKAPFRTCFSCLKEPIPIYEQFIMDFAKDQTDEADDLTEVVTDCTDVYERLVVTDPSTEGQRIFGKQRYAWKTCSAGGQIHLYDDDAISLAALNHLPRHLEHLTNEKVWMKSGGFLIIQHTEAMTVIDVNSGKSISKKNAQEHYLKLNLEAAKEIADQIRLRNISGIIMIDFIDMKNQADKDALLKAMKAAVKGDRVLTHVVDITRLQLMEMTRKKVKKSLKEQLT